MVEKNKILNTPEEVLNKFLKWFDKRKRLAFITTFIIGILTHITMLTETIMSQDGLWNSMQYFRPGNWELSLGRWGIFLIERLHNFIAIPTITTISCIFFMAVTAVIIIDLFDFKNKISIICTSAILVLTPTFAITLLYVYTSFSYCFCMMISCLAVWLIYKLENKKIGIFLGTILTLLTLSIYQSYVGLIVGLCIILSIIQLIKSENTTSEIFKQIIRTAISVIIGGILYIIITKILLDKFNLVLTNYKGTGNTIFNVLLSLKDSIIFAYKDFMAFFFRDRIVYNTNYRREVLYTIFFISSSILGILNIKNIKFENKKERNIKIIFILFLIAVLPLGLNIINILIAEPEIYALTASQMILIFPLSFAMLENIDKLSALKWVAVISCVFIMGTYYLADNTSYSALKLTYNQAYSTTERIIDRLETTPGYNKNCQIVFGGIVGNNNFPRTSKLYDFTVGSIVNNTVFHGTYGGQIGTWVNFIKIFFGLDVIPVDENIYYNIINSDEYKKMEIFPSPNSIRIQDGIITIKLSDEPPLPF